MSSKSNDDTYVFFEELSPFSNFHHSPFTLNNLSYKTCKHFIQSEKAKHYGNSKTELDILSCDTALEAKKLGHQINKSNDVRDWNDVAKELCAPGIKEKFNQKQEPKTIAPKY